MPTTRKKSHKKGATPVRNRNLHNVTVDPEEDELDILAVRLNKLQLKRKKEMRENKYLCELLVEQITANEAVPKISATKELIMAEHAKLKESFRLFRDHFDDSGDEGSDEKVEKAISIKFIKDAQEGIDRAEAYEAAYAAKLKGLETTVAKESWDQKIENFKMAIQLLDEQSAVTNVTGPALAEFVVELTVKKTTIETDLAEMKLSGEEAKEANLVFNTSVSEALKKAVLKVNLLPGANREVANRSGSGELLPTKVEKVTVPTFYGQKKHYAQWKRKYVGLTGTGGTETAKLVHLIDHLCPTVGETFAQYETVDTVWKHLDANYTNPESVMKEIMTDIRAFSKCIAGNHRSFLQFVKMVEVAVVDMKFNKLDNQMNYAEFVSTLESKLPDAMNEQWNEEVTEEENAGPATIEMFMSFITKKKRKAERMVGPLCDKPGDNTKPKEHVHGFEEGKQETPKKQMIPQPCDYCDKMGHRSIMCEKLHSDGYIVAEEIFKKKGLCGRCARKGHLMKVCRSNWKGVCKTCRQNHCQYICGTSIKEFLNTITTISSTNSSNGSLLILQSVKVNNSHHGLIFYDKGSSCNLVRQDFAKKIGLQGKLCDITIVTVGKRVEKIKSELYDLTMYDNYGGKHFCKLYGIPEISSEIEYVNISGILKHFEKYKLDLSKIVRPTGRIDVLLGMQAHRLHPKPIPNVEYENLSIYSSPFSTGLLVAGYDETIKASTLQRSSIAHMLCKAEVTEVSFSNNEVNKELLEDAKLHHLKHLPWGNYIADQKDSVMNTRLAEWALQQHMRLNTKGSDIVTSIAEEVEVGSAVNEEVQSKLVNMQSRIESTGDGIALCNIVTEQAEHCYDMAPYGAPSTLINSLAPEINNPNLSQRTSLLMDTYVLAGINLKTERFDNKYKIEELDQGIKVKIDHENLNTLSHLINHTKSTLDKENTKFMSKREAEDLTDTFKLTHLLSQVDLALHKEGPRPKFIWDASTPLIEFTSLIKSMYHNQNYKHPIKNDSLYRFFECEEWGVSPMPRCRQCSNCKECKFINTHMSHVEALEYNEMKNNLKIDLQMRCWVTRLPYKESPMVLSNNRFQVIKMMEQQEKRFLKQPELMVAYNHEIDEYVQRGVLVELSDEYMSTWTGPVSYSSHMGVISMSSQTTKLRVVVNGSLMHGGQSLNSILMQGPNVITSLEGILMRWREHRFCWAGDIIKMYHSIRTTEDDLNVTRVVWRHGDINNKIKTYGHGRLGMGILSAGTISKIAISQTAEMNKEEYPEASQILLDDTYVDDNISGTDDEARVEPLIEEIKEVASRGGFNFKPFVVSGQSPDLKLMKVVGGGELGKVLGVGWLPMEDLVVIPVVINLFGKKNGISLGPDEVIGEPLKGIITKRTTLRASHLTFDPAGLCSPITIKFKLSTRKLSLPPYKEYKWDKVLPEEIAEEWHLLIQQILHVAHLKFPRCVRPHHCYNPRPVLIIFSDASTEALATVAYWRFEIHRGVFKCFFIIAKSRVMPLSLLTIPRAELQAGVMAARLRKSILKHTKFDPSQIFQVIDNNPMLSIINAENVRAFKEFVAVRVNEIHDKTNASDWVWVKSADNIADLGTRGNATIDDITMDSEWINAPDWCRLPIEQWPIDKNKIVEIPEEDVINVKAHAVDITVSKPMIDVYRFSRIEKLLWTIMICRRIFLVKKSKKPSETLAAVTRSGVDYGMVESRKILEDLPMAERVVRNKHVAYCKYKVGQLDFSVSEVVAAEEIMEQEASMSLLPRMEKGEFLSLNPKVITRDGLISGITTQVIIIKSRADDGCDMEREYIVLMPSDHAFTRLYLKKIHDRAHLSENKNLASARSRYWIVRGGYLAKSIRKKCFECKIRKKMHMEQIISPLFPVRYTASPPWRKVGLDLFGPITVKDFIKQRTTRKCWIVVIICKGTRSCHIDVTEDFSAESVLKTIMRFVYRNGAPKEITSDAGSQLCAIARRGDNLENVEKVTKAKAAQGWTYMKNKMASMKVAWDLTPVKGQHYNGDTERLIDESKKILLPMINSSTRSLTDVQTAMFEIAYVLNCRPIGKRLNVDPLDGGALCPNMMLMGRSGIELEDNWPDFIDEFSHENFETRTKYSENIVQHWWSKLMKDCFAALAPTYTWRKLKPGLQEGDICLMKDCEEIKSRYKLGRVVEMKPSRMDGLERRIILEYRPTNSKAKGFSRTERPLQNLVLVVPHNYKESEL